MPRAKALAFDFYSTAEWCFGGQKTWGEGSPKAGLAKTGHPKTKRPEAIKTAIHLVLRSSRARGQKNLLLFDRQLRKILASQAKKQGIRIYDVANAGNHLHIVLKLSRRNTLAPFLRSVTGLIARKVLKAERGGEAHSSGARGAGHVDIRGTGRAEASLNAHLDITRAGTSRAGSTGRKTNVRSARFWDARPFTRILSGWGREFIGLRNYLMLNRVEMTGMERLSSKAMLKKAEEIMAKIGLTPLGFTAAPS